MARVSITSKLNPLVSGDTASLEWENDEDMIRQLYGLSNIFTKE